MVLRKCESFEIIGDEGTRKLFWKVNREQSQVSRDYGFVVMTQLRLLVAGIMAFGTLGCGEDHSVGFQL